MYQALVQMTMELARWRCQATDKCLLVKGPPGLDIWQQAMTISGSMTTKFLDLREVLWAR